MTIISDVCFCANDHEGCYAILHRAHAPASNYALMHLHKSSFALVSTTYCVNLAIFMRNNCGAVPVCMLYQFTPNPINDHHSYKSCCKHTQRRGLTTPGALHCSLQAFLLGVSILCRSRVDPVYPECVSHKARNHLPQLCFLARSVSHVPRPPHCTLALN